MQTENRFLDDLARLTGGAVSVVVGVRNEAETILRQRIERLLAGMELVGREEFDAVKAMAAKARAEQEALAERVAHLEAASAAAKAKGGSRRTRAKAPPAEGRRPAGKAGGSKTGD